LWNTRKTNIHINRLETAIESEDIYDLQESIALAGTHYMSDKPQYLHAVKLCQTLTKREKARKRIEKLSSSKNANMVLEQADELTDAIEEAKELGVQGERAKRSEPFGRLER